MTTDIIQVRFRSSQKAYSFDPDGIRFTPGESAIVETARGMECGLCVTGNRPATEEELSRPLKKILRKASEKDLSQNEENIKKEQEAFALCQEKIAHHKLDMKLISAEYAFDRSKLLFCFTSDNRVDFRELVKDLAATFRTRIELRHLEYCEVIHRTLLIHLTSGKVLESTGSLDELNRQLEPYGCFLRPHRSFLINLDHVQNLSHHSITMSCMTEIPLPRGKYQEVKDAYLEHMCVSGQVIG